MQSILTSSLKHTTQTTIINYNHSQYFYIDRLDIILQDIYNYTHTYNETQNN